MTIFEKIIARQIPAKIIWEDDDAIAFHDVDPQAPVHVLIVPKKVVPHLTDATDDDRALLGKLLLVARDLAKELALSSGYRVVINCGPDAGESVPHLHVRAGVATRINCTVRCPQRIDDKHQKSAGTADTTTLRIRLPTHKGPVDSDDALIRKGL